MQTVALLVEQYVPMANKLASQKKKALPKCIAYDELQSAAYMGLVEAASRFKEELGLSFSTYAYIRINGAILDYLRELGWGKKKDLKTATSLEYDIPKETVDSEEELFEDLTVDLPEKGQSLLRSYFIDQESMADIGKKMGVSEGRICQLIKYYKGKIAKTRRLDQSRELAA
jgi:RNA polymerase sigma factor (sigma-70 family)